MFFVTFTAFRQSKPQREEKNNKKVTLTKQRSIIELTSHNRARDIFGYGKRSEREKIV